MKYRNRLVRLLAVSAAIVLPLACTSTASADIVQNVPTWGGAGYQKPTKPGKELGIYGLSASAQIETADGSTADMSCNVHVLGTVLFDASNKGVGGKACALGNVEVVGTGALCPLLQPFETQLADFSGPYTVNADGSITIDPVAALSGLAQMKVTLYPNLNVDTMAFTCMDTGPADAQKSWLVCTGTMVKINKKPKDATGKPVVCP